MWDVDPLDPSYDEEVEIAHAREREKEAEAAEQERERRRMADFDAALDAYEAEKYGPIYYLPLGEIDV